MKKRYDYNLTEGNILRQLLLVSLPVMGTSLVQMAYNLTDLMWLGRVNGKAVASAGFAGFFTWLAAAFILLIRIGTEVRVSQRVGANLKEDAKQYAKTGVQLEFFFGIAYGLVLFVFADFWISFFGIEDPVVLQGAIDYLKIVAIGMVFYNLSPIFSAAINGTGNTLSPFLISLVGMVLNMILDPVFIIGFQMGVRGAAIATVIGQIVVLLFFLLYFYSRDSILSKVNYFSKIDWKKAQDILRMGIPAALQSAFFTFIAMIISRIVVEVSGDSASANAAQKIGSQIESLSWLVSGGIATALGAFVGQNFGAKKYDRVFRGIRYANIAMIVYGAMITLLLFFFAEPLFTVFIPDEPDTINIGIQYLRILAFSQIPMIIESIIGGAFNGLGKTVPQSVVSIIFNASRIWIAYLLVEYFGLNGIWWAISLSSILKGIVLWIWFKIYLKHTKDFEEHEETQLTEPIFEY